MMRFHDTTLCMDSAGVKAGLCVRALLYSITTNHGEHELGARFIHKPEFC
jgi:hypothetical protein